MTRKASLNAYARFYETLTPETIGRLRALVAPDIQFRDPFNETRGVAALERVLAKMFEDVVEPKFETLHTMTDGAVGYMKWRLVYRPKSGGQCELVGLTELHFDEAGRVTRHIDFWDPASQIYERIPVLGFVLRKIRRRIAA